MNINYYDLVKIRLQDGSIVEKTYLQYLLGLGNRSC